MKDVTAIAERMIGLKLLVLTTVVLSLTLAKPAVMTVHKGAHKVCSLIMQPEECGKHC